MTVSLLTGKLTGNFEKLRGTRLGAFRGLFSDPRDGLQPGFLISPGERHFALQHGLQLEGVGLAAREDFTLKDRGQEGQTAAVGSI